MRKNSDSDHRSNIGLRLEAKKEKQALKFADHATALAAHPWA